MLSMIADLYTGILVPAITIPVWDQYVGLVRWALDSLAQVFHSGGLAIIAFTIIIKTILLPLTVKSTRSAKAMQELQPKIKELQKKHAKDRQRLTQETMALYQQYQVNPMAGCLPMLLQIPIFLGLYQGIFSLSQGQEGASEYWSGPFLWLSNGLANSDPLFILPIVAGLFQFVQTRMMRPYKQGKISDPQQAMMNQVMNIMPLTVIAFGWGFASGPVLYWATQSLYSVAQQWIITGWGSMRDWFEFLPELPEHRRLGYRSPEDLAKVTVVTGADGKPVPPAGVMGWVQSRMADAQAQAESRRGAAPAAATTTNGATSDNQESKAPASSVRVTGSNRGARAKRGKGGVYKSTKPATANGEPSSGNGQDEAAPATGTGRAVVIPRKARSVTAEDGR
jgi:YidC/Oxa1 family membrane protein insertase